MSSRKIKHPSDGRRLNIFVLVLPDRRRHHTGCTVQRNILLYFGSCHVCNPGAENVPLQPCVSLSLSLIGSDPNRTPHTQSAPHVPLQSFMIQPPKTWDEPAVNIHEWVLSPPRDPLELHHMHTCTAMHAMRCAMDDVPRLTPTTRCCRHTYLYTTVL